MRLTENVINLGRIKIPVRVLGHCETLKQKPLERSTVRWNSKFILMLKEQVASVNWILLALMSAVMTFQFP